MESGKINRRRRYTLSVIREAFFSLLAEVGFAKMTVADICRRADINRGTFYLHYEDKFALLDALIDEAVREPLEWIVSDAERKSACDDIVKSGDRKQLMQLVGMLYRRREALKDQKKHFHNIDAQYLKTAERMLHGELAYALGIAADDVADYIRRRTAGEC